MKKLRPKRSKCTCSPRAISDGADNTTNTFTMRTNKWGNDVFKRSKLFL